MVVRQLKVCQEDREIIIFIMMDGFLSELVWEHKSFSIYQSVWKVLIYSLKSLGLMKRLRRPPKLEKVLGLSRAPA